MKLFLSVISATALFVAIAHGQTSSTTTTTTGGTTAADTTQATTTTTTESTGTVTEYSPGASIVLNTGTGEPTHYRFSKSVTYVTPEGKVIEASKVRKNSKVRVHYMKEGGDMVVDKVIVTD
jgi:diphthamide biosynthesis methyltransferase